MGGTELVETLGLTQVSWWAKVERREAQLTLAQTTLTMVDASEIGGSRLTLDELSPDSPLSVTTARPRERARGHRRHITMDATDDHHRDSQMAGGRTLSFSHYTTEGIFIHGGPPLGSFLEPSRPRAAAPRRRRVVLEWEFSLTISGNSQIIA